VSEKRSAVSTVSELVVTAQRGIELAPIEDAAIRAVLQTLEGDRRALHVLKQRLQFLAILCPQAAIA
jgi:hypothetical protein